MKKLILILFVLATVAGCKKSDSDDVKKDVTYTIKVTLDINNSAYTSYSFYEPNEKLRVVKGSYETTQTYEKGKNIQVSAIFCGQNCVAQVPINIQILKNGDEVLNKTEINDLIVSFVAD